MRYAYAYALRSNGLGEQGLAGSGRAGLSGAQKALLKSGEIAADNIWADAEVTAMKYIERLGGKVIGGGSNRNICPWCENFIRNAGGQLVGPTTPGRVNNHPYNGEREFVMGQP